MDFDRYFQKSDLIPAIVQEQGTCQVLMLAYMNKESLKKTYETGYTWFWSRSRQELWNKGATSGHLQKVVDIKADCDDDTLLVTVIQTGAACHTGNRTCFFNELMKKEYDDYKTKISNQEKLVTSYEDRYYKKFSAMELTISKMQQNYSAFLS